VELPEALESAATTCSTRHRKLNQTPSDVPRVDIANCQSKSDFKEKLLVQILLSIWLLRSKIHRKEFRRKG